MVHPNNKLTLEMFLLLDAKDSIWWKCGSGHEWQAKIQTRLHSKGNCPICITTVAPETSLSFLFPSVAMYWDYSKNVLLPTAVSPGSKKFVWWKCSKCGLEWQTQIRSRTRGKCPAKCPGCKKLPIESSLASLNPKIAKDWHPTKNSFSPLTVPPSSKNKVWWKCKGCGHEWRAQVRSRTEKDSSCPKCAKISGNSLSLLFPEIAKDWHPNNPDLACSISAASKKKVWWHCHTCEYEWQTQVRSRTNCQSKCPNCYVPNKSEREIRISLELLHCFEQLDVINPKIYDQNQIIHVDMLLPKYKVIIEYDGNSIHKDKLESDTKKTERLTTLGYKVIRLREDPLPLTSNLDLRIEKKTSIKMCVDNLLLHMLKELSISSPHHEDYILRKKCINTTKANTFITKYKLVKLAEASHNLAKTLTNTQITFADNIIATLEKSISKISQRKSLTVKLSELVAPMSLKRLGELNKQLAKSGLAHDEEMLLRAKKKLAEMMSQIAPKQHLSSSTEEKPPYVELIIPTSYKPIVGFEKPSPPKPEPAKLVEDSDEELISRFRKWHPTLDDAGVLVEAKKIRKIMKELGNCNT